MKITSAGIEDAKIIASIVSRANKEVADQFGITFENTPKHPSFYTKKLVVSDIHRGEEYFLSRMNNVWSGCVAFEQERPDTAYLNRLAVLPEYRNQGTGRALVNHIFGYARSKNVKFVSIGIIAAHSILKHWYSSLGFIQGETKRFDHLAFDVTYMRYNL